MDVEKQKLATTKYARRYGGTVPWIVKGLRPVVTYEEVASELGISKERVHQIERTALKRLRRCLELIGAGMPIDEAVELCRGKNGRPRKDSQAREAAFLQAGGAT